MCIIKHQLFTSQSDTIADELQARATMTSQLGSRRVQSSTEEQNEYMNLLSSLRYNPVAIEQLLDEHVTRPIPFVAAVNGFLTSTPDTGSDRLYSHVIEDVANGRLSFIRLDILVIEQLSAYLAIGGEWTALDAAAFYVLKVLRCVDSSREVADARETIDENPVSHQDRLASASILWMQRAVTQLSHSLLLSDVPSCVGALQAGVRMAVRCMREDGRTVEATALWEYLTELSPPQLVEVEQASQFVHPAESQEVLPQEENDDAPQQEERVGLAQVLEDDEYGLEDNHGASIDDVDGDDVDGTTRVTFAPPPPQQQHATDDVLRVSWEEYEQELASPLPGPTDDRDGDDPGDDDESIHLRYDDYEEEDDDEEARTPPTGDENDADDQ